ncbi:MAG: hypothetical protein HPAVJP_1670 [Candidatus Hepatoplasma vulgare]|nr:MAG: hypothetical protein HPAVJP_1670 [Candidatus Hepatoplasma sp.]
MNTPITSDDLLFIFSQKIENKKISDIFKKENFDFFLNKHKNEKINAVIDNNLEQEKKRFNFPRKQEFNFSIKNCQLEYSKNDKLVIKNRIKIKKFELNEMILNESLFKTNFWKNNKNMFIVFIKKNTNWKNAKIIKSKLIKLEENIKLKNILENDYQIIRNKIFLGKAHELAEGDTKFLGVVRDQKIKKKPNLIQPHSDKKFYPRTLIFKNHFMQILFDENNMKNDENTTQIEKSIKKNVLNYKNKSIAFLMEEFQINKLYPKIKEDIFFRILNVGSAVEFNNEENTDFNFYTITLNNKNEINNKIKINFNLIQQLKNPKNWEESETLKEIEKTSFVLIYKESEKNKLNPKILDIKKINFSDDTVDILREEYKKMKEEVKKISKKTRIKEKYLYLDNEIVKKELRDI